MPTRKIPPCLRLRSARELGGEKAAHAEHERSDPVQSLRGICS